MDHDDHWDNDPGKRMDTLILLFRKVSFHRMDLNGQLNTKLD